MAWPPVTHQDVQDAVSNLRAPTIDVRNYGATGNGTTDDTAALQAAIAALPSNGSTLSFPPGTYLTSGTLDFGSRSGVRVTGAGKPGQSAAVGVGATTIKYTGTGWGIQWAVGAGSALFNGITIENLHVQGNSNSAGGIWLGNTSNSVIRDVAVSDFKNGTTTGTGIKVGDTTTNGAQYNMIDNVTVSTCDVGIDVVNANGTRIVGGFLEDTMPTPRAGTYGVRVRADSDTVSLIGLVVQGFATLLDLAGESASALGVRGEGFTAAGYNISGAKASIIGGSISNSGNPGVGTALNLTATATSCLLLTPNLGTVAARLVDAGSQNTYIVDPREASQLYSGVQALTASSLAVVKSGAGAQDPQVTLASNATVGPTWGTESSFSVMRLDHAWGGASRLSLRVAGTEALAVGASNKLSFFGGAPAAKPTVTGAKGGNAALGSLLSALSALGLVTDSTTA